MRLKHTALAFALVLSFASAAYPQGPDGPQKPNAPDFSMQVWGEIAADFSARVRAYFELRRELEKGLPPFTTAGDPAEIRKSIRALAKRVRAARANTREGDIFTPGVTVEFRKVLLLELNEETRTVIRADYPGDFPARINVSYPDEEPLSTVPPGLLAALPSLPEDIQYRFAGCHLILLDVKANVILDRIPHAIHAANIIDR